MKKEDILREFISEFFEKPKPYINIDNDVRWAIEELLKDVGALMTQAKFKKGGRVVIIQAPEISFEASWGWMGSKHFLVVGAEGAVEDVYISGGKFRYDVMWDDESWKDDKGVIHPRARADKHLYSFQEELLDHAPARPARNIVQSVTKHLLDRLYRYTGD